MAKLIRPAGVSFKQIIFTIIQMKSMLFGDFSKKDVHPVQALDVDAHQDVQSHHDHAENQQLPPIPRLLKSTALNSFPTVSYLAFSKREVSKTAVTVHLESDTVISMPKMDSQV